MKTILLILFCFVQREVQSQHITTFILVRHAEKVSDGSKDPELTEEGKQRALRLAELLKETKVDAIYSTSFKRTMNTVTPLAFAKGMEIHTYDALKPGPIDELLAKFPGGTVVLVGHSNSIPWTANYLTGSETYKNFNEADYGNVMIVEVIERGKAKVVWLKY